MMTISQKINRIIKFSNLFNRYSLIVLAQSNQHISDLVYLLEVADSIVFNNSIVNNQFQSFYEAISNFYESMYGQEKAGDPIELAQNLGDQSELVMTYINSYSFKGEQITIKDESGKEVTYANEKLKSFIIDFVKKVYNTVLGIMSSMKDDIERESGQEPSLREEIEESMQEESERYQSPTAQAMEISLSVRKDYHSVIDFLRKYDRTHPDFQNHLALQKVNNRNYWSKMTDPNNPEYDPDRAEIFKKKREVIYNLTKQKEIKRRKALRKTEDIGALKLKFDYYWDQTLQVVKSRLLEDHADDIAKIDLAKTFERKQKIEKNIQEAIKIKDSPRYTEDEKKKADELLPVYNKNLEECNKHLTEYSTKMKNIKSIALIAKDPSASKEAREEASKTLSLIPAYTESINNLYEFRRKVEEIFRILIAPYSSGIREELLDDSKKAKDAITFARKKCETLLSEFGNKSYMPQRYQEFFMKHYTKEAYYTYPVRHIQMLMKQLDKLEKQIVT